MPIYEAVVYRRVVRLEKALISVKADSDEQANRLASSALAEIPTLDWNLEYSTMSELPYVDKVEAVADDDDERLIQE